MPRPVEKLQFALVFAAVALVSVTAARIGTITITDVLFVGALVVSLIGPATTLRYLRINSGVYTFGAFLVVIAGCISRRLVSDSSDVFANTTKLAFLFLLFMPLVGVVANGRRPVKLILMAYIGIPLVAVVGAIIEYTTGWQISERQTEFVQVGDRLIGFTQHSNELGIVVSLVTPLALAVLLDTRSRAIKIYCFTSLLSAFLCILLSKCFTGGIGAVFGIVCVLPSVFKVEGRYKQLVWSTIAGLFIVIFIASVKIFRSDIDEFVERWSYLSYANDSNTVMIRAEGLKELLSDRSFYSFSGAGVNTVYDSYGNAAHNIFARSFLELGAIGLFGILLMLTWMITEALKLFRVPMNSLLFKGVGATVLVFFLEAQTAPVLFQRHFWICAAIIFVFRGKDGKELNEIVMTI